MDTRKTAKPGAKKIASKIFLGCLDAFFLLLGAALIFFVYAYLETPVAASLVTRAVPRTSVIYDRTGKHVLYEIHGEENRKVITHEEIPKTIKIATIAAEDDAFYRHYGLDFASIARAMQTNIRNGSITQGGSTITQQLARNVFLTREKTFQRKFIEAILAVKIERKYTKDQILDIYFNEIPYGSNAYGVQAASETFFGKDAKDLTLDEAALLAALPKATSYYSPYGENRKQLAERQKKILERIASLGLDEENAVQEALREDTLAKVLPFRQNIDAPHFVMYVIEELDKKYGNRMLKEGGLKIYTTLDKDLQGIAENTLKEAVNASLTTYGASNAALVAIDPRSGEILAMAGSVDYFNDSIDGQVNVALSPRQPGSSFKPFAYARAFEEGYQPETFVLDARTNFGPDGSGRPYIPRNYDGRYRGMVTIRQALAMSLNIPAVKALAAVGLDDTIELAHRLGITTLNDRNRYGLSLVLGGGEVRLLDMVSGFSVFANDGRKNEATPILKIVGSDGKVYTENEPANQQVLDQQVARKINSVLSDNAARTPVFGRNNKLFVPGRTVAAKTGTTQEYRDAWTIGYTPYLAAGVWAGNNDNHPMRAGAAGTFVAAPIWNRFMAQAIQDRPDQTFVAYEKPAGADARPKTKVTYYKKSDGKKISEKKAKKMDDDEVEVRVEWISPPSNNTPLLLSSGEDKQKISLKDWKRILK